MRIRTAAISVALAGLFSGTAVSLLTAGAAAQTAQATRTAQASQPAADERPAQPAARRPTTRLRIYPRYQAEPDEVYPRYFPGRNAVRECNATYVQEYRPSGTVIVPRMNCYWRRG
jgi:hypothetical protein